MTLGELAYGPAPVPSLSTLDVLLTKLADSKSPAPADRDAPEVALGSYWTAQAAGPPAEHVRYYHSDQLGGPSYVTNAAGELESFTGWYPYGGIASEQGWRPNHTFTGAEREPEAELGLIQMGARWYAPGLGRWLSPDPLFLWRPEKGLDLSLELNIYSYGRNSPTGRLDPEGTDTTEIGFDLNAYAGPLGFDLSVSVAWDSEGGIAVTGSASAKAGSGAGVAAGLFGEGTNVETVADLRGPMTAFGTEIMPAVGFEGEILLDKNGAPVGHGSVISLSLGADTGTPVTVRGGYTVVGVLKQPEVQTQPPMPSKDQGSTSDALEVYNPFAQEDVCLQDD